MRPTTATILCAVCGKRSYKAPTKTRKYCSRRCYMTVGRNYLRDAWLRHIPPPVISKCRICKKAIKTVRSHPRIYCSQHCYNKKRAGLVVKCTECEKSFYQYRSWAKKRLRCSKKCANAYMRRTFRPSSDHMAKCRAGWNNLDQTNPVLREKRRRATLSAYAEGRIKKRVGSASNLWKGGIASVQNIERQRAYYRNWRKAVYERDGYKCRVCGISSNLHAHHIKEFAKYPNLRYDIANGMTVCRDCHSKIHGRLIPNIGEVHRKVELLKAA